MFVRYNVFLRVILKIIQNAKSSEKKESEGRNMSVSERKIGALITGTSVIQSLRRIAPDQQDVFREELKVEPFYYQRSGLEEMQFDKALIHTESYKFFFQEVIKEPAKLSVFLYNLYILLELEKFQEIIVKDDQVESFMNSLKQTIASCLLDLKSINLFMENQASGFSEDHFFGLNELYGNSNFSDMHANKIFKLVSQLTYLEALIRPQREILNSLMDKLPVVRAFIFANPYRPGAEPSAEEKEVFRQSLMNVSNAIKEQGDNFFIEHADIFGGNENAQKLQDFFNSGIDIDALEQGIIHNSQDPLKKNPDFKRDVNADIYLEAVIAISMTEQTARAYLCKARLQVQVFQYLSRLEPAIAETIKVVSSTRHPIAVEMKKKIAQFNQFKADGVALGILEKLYAEDNSENSLQTLFLGEGLFKKRGIFGYHPFDGYLRTLPKEKYKKELEAIKFLKALSQLNYKNGPVNFADVVKNIKQKGFVYQIPIFKIAIGNLDAEKIDEERERLKKLSISDLVKEVAALAEKALLLAIPVLELFSQTEYFLKITQYDPKLPPDPETNSSLGPNNELFLLLTEIKKVKEMHADSNKEKQAEEVEPPHNSLEELPPHRTRSVSMPASASSGETSFPLDKRISEITPVAGIKLLRSSLARTPSPPSVLALSVPSVSPFSSPECELSLESPGDNFAGRNSVEARVSPNPNQVASGASNFFKRKLGLPAAVRESQCDSSTAQQKPDGIFINENIDQKREQSPLSDAAPSSGSELQSSPRNSKDRNSVEARISPNLDAYGLFGTSFGAATVSIIESGHNHCEVQEKSGDIFTNENVNEKRDKLSTRLGEIRKKRTTPTKDDIELMRELSAAGNAGGLFALAQAARNGDIYDKNGKRTKDTVAAYYLALLAYERTTNDKSRSSIKIFLEECFIQTTNNSHVFKVNIRIGNQDYSPKDLHQEVLRRKANALPQPVAVNGCSH